MSKDNLSRLLIAFVLMGVLACTSLRSGDFSVTVIMWVALNALAAASLRFMMLVGELNVATAAFYGLGAYVSSISTVWYGMPLIVSLLVGGLVAAAISALFGYVTLRTKGPYFLLVSFAFTEVVRMIYTRIDAIGANSGMVGIFPSRALTPWVPTIVVTTVVLMLVLLYALERSTLGTIFRAIQNNDAVVQSVGINIMHVKVLCLTVASFAAGVDGGLHAHINNVISPPDFSFLLAVFALAYVKIGGEQHILGAVLGATLMTVLGQYLLGFGGREQIFLGGSLVVAMLVLPDGLLGLIQRIARWFTARSVRITPSADYVEREMVP